MTEHTTPTVDLAALKARQQATWASGDYAVVGTTLQIVGERLCETIDLRAGSKVLDVAAGNGNATLAAARRFCEVTSTDYVPALLERGRARAAAERQDIAFSVEDAEAMSFPDASFDVVLSTFGVMFTADHAGRRRRCCGSASPAAPSPWRTGRPRASSARSSRPSAATCRRRRARSRRRSGARGTRSRRCSATARARSSCTRQTFAFRYRSPGHFLEVFRTWYGPTHKAFQALGDKGAALEADLLALLDSLNTARDGTLVVPSGLRRGGDPQGLSFRRSAAGPDFSSRTAFQPSSFSGPLIRRPPPAPATGAGAPCSSRAESPASSRTPRAAPGSRPRTSRRSRGFAGSIRSRVATRHSPAADRQQVERHPDREVRAQRRVHRDQHRLAPLLERGLGPHHPVEDRLAVLVLADLQERRVVGRLDEVALRVDQEQPHLPAEPLAADQHRGRGRSAASAPSARRSGRRRRSACARRSRRPRASVSASMIEVGAAPRRAISCCSLAIAVWVTDRLPAVRITITRSPGSSKTNILR